MAVVHYFCSNGELLPWLRKTSRSTGSLAAFLKQVCGKDLLPTTTSSDSVDCGFSPPALNSSSGWSSQLPWTATSSFWRSDGKEELEANWWTYLVTTNWQNQGPNPRPLILSSLVFSITSEMITKAYKQNVILSKVIQDRKSLFKKATAFYFIIQDNWSSWTITGLFSSSIPPFSTLLLKCLLKTLLFSWETARQAKETELYKSPFLSCILDFIFNTLFSQSLII